MSLAGNPYGIAMVICGSGLLVFSVLAVGLRIWARRLKKRALVVNDWAVIAALVSLAMSKTKPIMTLTFCN